MEDNKKYIYTFDTVDWKIGKCEIARETHYTWKTALGYSFPKDCYCKRIPGSDYMEFWNPDLKELKRTRKNSIEYEIRSHREAIERLESLLAQEQKEAGK